MESVLVFRALGYGVIGLLLLAVLVLSLVSMRKEGLYDEPIGGLFSLNLIIIFIYAVIALCTAYQTATSLQKLAPRMQTEVGNVQ